MSDKNRNQLIDIIKGIGIVLVVAGHLNTDGQISRIIIYSFHMPLFFFISGVLQSKKQSKFRTYFIKIFKTLFLPYIVFVIVDIFAKIIVNDVFSPIKLFKLTVLDLIGYTPTTVNSPLWFLYALFFIKLISFFVLKNKYICFITIFISIAFVFIYTYNGVGQGFFRNAIIGWSIPGIAFYLIGTMLKDYIFSIDNNKTYQKFIYFFAPVCLIVYCVLIRFSPYVSMKNLVIPVPSLYYLNSFFGIVIVLALSLVIEKVKLVNKFLVFYGKNSIYVLVYHIYLSRYLFPYLIKKAGYEMYLYNPIMELILLIIVLLLLIIPIKLSKNYLFFLFGKTNNKKLNR